MMAIVVNPVCSKLEYGIYVLVSFKECNINVEMKKVFNIKRLEDAHMYATGLGTVFEYSEYPNLRHVSYSKIKLKV